MPESISHGFSSDFFMPHGHCYLWQPGMLWLQVSSNGLIGLSYVAIASTLAFLVWHVRDLPFKTMYVAFGVFIVSCGVTHFFDIWVIWKPDYWLDGSVRAVTAAASLGTALTLPPLVPRALALMRGARAAHERGIKLETAVSDLEQMYEKARELEVAKTQFFANASHELRTPLTLILGPVDKLRRQPNLSEEQRRDLDVVFRNAQTLLKHVNDLLDVARLESGKMTVEYAKVDASRLVRRAAAHFDSIAEELGIDYELKLKEQVACELDPHKIERVVLNLLSNAFKYTPQGGHIFCEVERAKDVALGPSVIVRIADSGPGIPENARTAIFERFGQLTTGPARAIGGTGLGLAIAKDLVELHSGSIDVTESAFGGALFTFKLPERAPDGSEVRESLPDDERSVRHTGGVAIEELRRRASSAPPAGEHGLPLVLVVEDNADMNDFVRGALSDGYRTVSARDGRDGLTKALDLSPDLVLTDVMMPHMTGDQLVRELRARTQFDAMPIVLLTAKSDDRLRVDMLKSGAQDYLMKPFSAEELRARLGNLVSIKRTRDILQSELGEQLGDLERLAREVTSKKQDLETALESLRVARDVAEQASAVKSNFLRLVSHELRTPLTAIRLHLDRWKLERTLPESQRRVVERMYSSIQRLTDLVESLLEHARIESGRLAAEFSEFDLRALVEGVVDEYRPQAALKSLTLSCRASDGLSRAKSDHRLLRLVLVNLVGNAIKFTSTGKVTLALAEEKGQFRIDVSDTGPGIAPEFQRAIFEPFQQLESIRHKHTPGVGLGLALVQEMTAALNGRIELESKVSEGSTFTLWLPAVVAKAAGSGRPRLS